VKRKGISPVIATVIIVAVAIAIAIAVAFWMTGIIGLFTRFEKLEVTYCYAEWSDDSWTVKLKVRNTGSADATIVNIFINGKPYTAYSPTPSISPTIPTDGLPLKSGEEQEFTITLDPDAGFEHGMSVEFKIVTASGQEYPKMTNLP